MNFKGTIVITDPCYIDTKDDKIWSGDDINIFTGKGLEKMGFTSYIWDDTIYGDWSCTTFQIKEESKDKKTTQLENSDIEKSIGNFCADAGLVGVFLLDEVLKFNPDFLHKDGDHAATVIKDFDGDVQYEVNEETVQIRGRGNINFITLQSGF
jgi:hypothetical protein